MQASSLFGTRFAAATPGDHQPPAAAVAQKALLALIVP
jgi:hypothetical protein